LVSRRSVILASLLLAAFLISLDITIVNVALPSLVRELHASNSELQWVVDAYSLVFAALILAAGSLSDRLGRKGFLLAGLGVFGASSLAGGLTTSAGQLIVARCFMGAGAAMIFPATLSLISNVFTERGERARAIGLWGASSGAAIALGPIVGGWLLERFSWQSIFIVMAPVAAAGAVLVALSVPTSRDPHAPRLDLTGLALSTATMAALIYTIIEAPGHGWGSGRTLGGFAFAACLLAAFIVRERTAAEPMLDLGLFRNLRFSAASGSVTVAFFSLAGFIFLITQYFQFLKGYGPFAAGVRTLPVAIAVAVASILGTKLAVRFGTKLVVTAGLALLAVFFLWVSASTVTTTYLTIAITMVICGTGMGLTSTPATEAIMGVVPKDKAGVGSAVNDATRLLGSTLGVAVIGSIYASVYTTRLTSALPTALPTPIANATHQSIGAALAVAAHLHATGHAPIAAAVHHIAEHAFTHGLSIGCLVAAGVSATGAVLAGILLPAHPPGEPEDTAEPAPALQPVAAVD
jgi:EmrB/QacA subfamily drug resistance transporter